jgi:hypothetical protein
MLNPDTELLFPLRVVPLLAEIRGEAWQNFIMQMCSPQVSRVDQVTFVMMMVRLGGCVACNADSFRAMRGCTQCARQTIRRNRGSDQDLIRLFDQVRQELSSHYSRK